MYRLQFDVAKLGGEFLIDADTRAAPVFADEATLNLDVGLFERDVGLDLSDAESVSVSLLYGNEDVLATKTVTVDLDQLSLSAWNAKTAKNFSVEFSSDDMNYDFPAGESRLPVYMVVTAEFPESVTRVVGKGLVTLGRNFFGSEVSQPGSGSGESVYSAHSILAADGGKAVAARQIQPNELVGRRENGTIGSVPHPTPTEYQQGVIAQVRSWSPLEIKAAFEYLLANSTAFNSFVAKAAYTPLFSVLTSQATPGVPGAVQLAFNTLLGRGSSGGVVAIGAMGEGEVDAPGTEIRALTPANVKALIERWALSVDLSEETLFGRQLGEAMGEIARASNAEILAGTETQLRGVSPADLKAAVIAHKNGDVAFGPKFAHAWLGAAAFTPADTTPPTINSAGGLDSLLFVSQVGVTNQMFTLFSLPMNWDGGAIYIKPYWLTPGSLVEPPPELVEFHWLAKAAVWALGQPLPAWGSEVPINVEVSVGTSALLAASDFVSLPITGTPGSLVRLALRNAEGYAMRLYGMAIQYVVDEADYATGSGGTYAQHSVLYGMNFLRRVAITSAIVRAGLTVQYWETPGVGSVVGELVLNGAGTGVVLTLEADTLTVVEEAFAPLSLAVGDLLEFEVTSATGAHNPQIQLWTSN